MWMARAGGDAEAGSSGEDPGAGLGTGDGDTGDELTGEQGAGERPADAGAPAGAHDEAATAGPHRGAPAGHAPVHEREPRLRVLLYSDDPDTRAAVRLAVGRRPARDLPAVEWVECATAPAVVARTDSGGLDVVVLDGEATPVGGMGLCRQLKNEVYRCPPVLVLTGRPDDAWLAAWSLADAAVPHPLDPRAVAAAVADLARARLAAPRAG